LTTVQSQKTNLESRLSVTVAVGWDVSAGTYVFPIRQGKAQRGGAERDAPGSAANQRRETNLHALTLFKPLRSIVLLVPLRLYDSRLQIDSLRFVYS